MASIEPITTGTRPSASPNPVPSLSHPAPEVLAPAGGRAQFFAALHAGADAVYLGLKEFNARGRAENFTLEDLRELVPLAHAFGMKVLVAINIILKEAELPRLIDDLIELEWIGVDAVIVQDLGVARLIRERFPGLRLHASTQLAVHNLHGVLKAAELGFRRVVLARELTAQELRLIRQRVPREQVEIEVFCHGSLCYSYSGLCFFSGAADARSGNRGECAYTCRKPYKVLNEPGHGFLFSMKDLDTSADLDKLVRAGVDTLKIEGRKKDAQYVATVVGLYRRELDRIFARATAPQGRSVARDFRHDMAFSYHRERTSFFVKGRYHENVIDLGNPTHKGLYIGRVVAADGRRVEWVSEEPLERFDGLRFDREGPLYHAKPQHGSERQSDLSEAQKKYANEVCQFSLRQFFVGGRRVHEVRPGERVSVEIPSDATPPRVGDLVYKVRSNELKRHTEALTQAPAGTRLKPLSSMDLHIRAEAAEDGISIMFKAELAGRTVCEMTDVLRGERPRKSGSFAEDLKDAFTIVGELGIGSVVSLQGDFDWFVPRSQIKKLKNLWIDALGAAMERWNGETRRTALESLTNQRTRLSLATREPRYQVKIDRLETLDAVAAFARSHRDFALAEVIFEPKRAFLGPVHAREVLETLLRTTRELGAGLRLALPTVLRAWDEPLLKPWLEAMRHTGERAFEVGNLGAFAFLEQAGFKLEECDLTSDFTLYALNTEAVRQLSDLGCARVALSIEDDRENLRDKLRAWPLSGARPQAILYKDTPLFIAEACSLTALHHGCPTAKVCGYRTLEVENDEGERFLVAHESCKSIVYGAQAYGITQFRKELMAEGVQDFRIDFLTRPYDADAVAAVLDACRRGSASPSTHAANYLERLL